MPLFQVYSTIDNIKTLKNGGLKITIETQDLSLFTPEELAEIFKLNDKYVYVAIKETAVVESDLSIPEPPQEFKSDKSPSQRLRAVLYVYWEQNKPSQDFETFYKSQMEKFINTVKEKLN